MKLILLGAPGAGKGTQAEILSARLNIPTISTGNILRAAVRNGTPVGIEAKAYLDSGRLVPDDTIMGIIEERLSEADCANGWILDGMPRTIPQAEALEARKIGVDWAINLEVPDETIIKRMSGRRVCPDCGAIYHVSGKPPKQEGRCDACGGKIEARKDDNPETVKARLLTYHAETEPLKHYYASRGKLLTIHGRPEIEETTAELFKVLEL